jgi:hypothetical protein
MIALAVISLISAWRATTDCRVADLHLGVTAALCRHQRQALRFGHLA